MTRLYADRMQVTVDDGRPVIVARSGDVQMTIRLDRIRAQQIAATLKFIAAGSEPSRR
jgi:hypothetical protein